VLDAHVLPDHTGVILGTVFERGDTSKPARLANFNAQECERIRTSAGRSLIKHQWGRFVAVLRNPRDGTVRILRDPTAGVPCYYFEHKGVWFCLSDPEDAADAGVLSVSFNKDYLTAQAIMPGVNCEETALAGLYELLGGQCITVRNEKLSKDFYWHPADHAQAPPMEDPTAAALEVERLTRYGVESYAALHPNILLLASGGIDSSIVAACLQRTATRVTGFSAYADDPAGDERRYSRALKKSTGFEWIEQPTSTALLDARPPRAARPRLLFSAPQELKFIAAAKERGATGIVTGHGGDGVFYECRDHATEDYFATHGLIGLFEVARQSARLKRTSIPRELREVYRRETRAPYNPLADVVKYSKLVSAAAVNKVLQEPQRFTHGWLHSGTEALTPGQCRHISMLSFPFARALTWKPGYPDFIDPLLNPLLIEFLLALRAYTLLYGGRTRALARMGFAPFLPAEIIRRTDKGDTRGIMKELRRANLAAMRKTLLDGYLVQTGIIDGRAARDGLSDAPTDVFPSEPLRHYCMELTVQEWLRTQPVTTTAYALSE
jgi:asparagine synthase (glutamine-hydrolysing)